MSLEDQYDAWVRGLMGGGKYAATPKQAEDANDAVQQMQLRVCLRLCRRRARRVQRQGFLHREAP